MGTPTTADNCGVKSVTNDAPSVFPKGTTTVTWTVTDDSDNTQTATQVVTVTDVQKPTITAPANVSVNTDANKCTASGVALGTPTTADNCGVKSVTNDAPSVFTHGTTTVTWTVTDDSDNTQTATQVVTVTDVQKPTITAPANVAVNTDTNKCTASGVALGTPTTADNCGVKSVTNDAPSVFTHGTTTVTWTVTDDSDNTQTATQVVTVTDVQKPTITAPANVSVNTDANKCTASGVALGTPTTADNCGVKSVTNDAPSVFTHGTTTVTWTVTDDSDNTQTATQVVTVSDVQKPTITAPANVSVNTDANKCTASGVALGTPTTADNCGVKSVTNDAPSVFPKGTTTVTWTVTDDSNNTQTATQVVTVTDVQKPTITAPANVAVNTDTNKCTASGVALGTPTTADNCGVKSVTNDAPSVFTHGTTTVTWTVTDDSDNTQTATQVVTVTDVQKPTITAPANVAVNTDANKCTASGVALGTPSTADNCGVKNVTNDAPSVFTHGTTTVTWTVTDDSDNTQTATQVITVTDVQKPTITAPANVAVNTDANKCTASGVALGTPTTADNCGVKSVTNDAPSVFPNGTTTVTWTVTDDSDNTQTATQVVTVTDVQKPVISASANIVITNTPGQCYAGTTITTATATDNCSVGTPTGTRSDGQPLNATYPVGITTITWTVTDSNGNTASPVEQTVTVEDKEAPAVPQLDDVVWGCEYTFEIPTTTDNCDSDVDVTYTGSLTFSSSGQITWTFTDEAGNSSTATQNITIDPITVTAEKENVLCNGFATGSITATAAGGVGPYTYDWGSLGAGNQKTDLPAGTYSVKAIDANGCETAPLEVIITEPDTFVSIASLSTTTGCYKQNNGTATVEATGGVGNFTYLWSNGQTTQTATGLAPGSHSVKVTDGNGCSKDRTFTISAPQELKITGFSTTETTSYGSATGTATAKVSGGTPNYTFTWSNGATGQTARDLAAGEYTVTVTDANGCSTFQKVTIIDSIDAVIIPTVICEGEEEIVRTAYFEVEDLTAKGGTPGYTYKWNFGDYASPTTATGPGPHKVKYSVIGDKQVTLEVTDSKGLKFTNQIIQYVGGCFTNDCGSNDLTAEDYFVGDANGNRITSANCADSGQKYLYVSIPTNSERYSLNIEYIYSIENITTGEIFNDREAGCFYERQAIPDIARTIPIDYECGDIVKIEGIYLTFSNNDKWDCGQGPNPKCYSTNNETSVVIPLYAVAFGSELLCNGGSGTVNVRASGGTGEYTYKLISQSGATVQPFQDSNSFTGVAAGIYKVVVSDGVDTFTTSEVEVTQPSNQLTLSLSSQTGISCAGGTDGSATVVASGGTPNTTGEEYTYIWEGIGQTTPTATNLAAGTYTVRVIDSNGCETSLDVVIEDPAEIPANAGPDQVLPCGNLQTLLNASLVSPEGGPEVTGTWSIVNGPVGGQIEDVNDPQSKFSGEIGTYTLRWTVTCGATDDVKISFGSCSTLDFDGQNDHVIIGDKFDLPATFTIEAWVKQDAAKTSGIKTIFSERDNSSLSAGGFDLVVDNNIPKFRWNGSSIASTYPIGTDRWYHIAVILGGDATGLYVDGIKVSNSAPGQPTATTNPFIIGAAYNASTPNTPENYFHGWIEEVRLWKKALTLEQLRFLMNQRLNIGTSPLQGTALPIPVPGPLNSNTDLIAYYPLIVSDITSGTTKDKGPNGYDGTMVNIETLQENTAPLPYYSAKNGAWTADNTWLRPAVWDYPNSKGVDGSTFIDWNIVVAQHNITSQNKDITVLGLRSEAGRLSVSNPSGPQNENNSGQMLRVTHYLKLDGVIDLFGESQLIQDQGSVIDADSKGHLEKDQQGRASSYNYNYWSSPVSLGTGNVPYSVAAVMKDGTTTTYREINFGDAYTHADGPPTNPRKVSRYWIHKFHGTANNYFEWEWIGSTGTLNTAEGYSMKGTTGWAGLSDLQNYTFVGMPNNGTLERPVAVGTQGENYLVGNPYPSAIDAEAFIKDNLNKNVVGGATNTANIFNGTLYFWDHFSGATHYLERYIGGYATFNLSGGAAAISNDLRVNANNQEGTKKPGRYIPVGQAFFVNTKLDDAATGGMNITINGGNVLFQNSQRIYKREGIDKDSNGKDVSVFHSAEKKDLKTSLKAEERMRLWLRFKSPEGYYRQVLVTADKNTTANFDLGYDAPMIENNAEDMYWLINGGQFVIQGVPDFGKDRELPIGIRTTEGGEFQLSIDETENIPSDFEIYLKDSINNTYHDLRDSAFKAETEKGSIDDRYFIVFSKEELNTDPDPVETETPGEEEEEKEEETKTSQITLLYSSTEKEITIKNPELLLITEATLYNSLGQELKKYGSVPVQKVSTLPVKIISAGVYFVKLKLEDGSVSLKFLVE